MPDDLLNPYSAPQNGGGIVLPPADCVEEGPLGLREESAQRALKAALIGLVMFPLQFYAIWLLLKVCFYEGPLRPRLRRNATWAAIIAVAHILFVGGLLRIVNWSDMAAPL
jgi:hypothetical protein